MSVKASLTFGATVTETLTSGVAAADNPVIRFAAFNESVTLDGTTTPAITKHSSFVGTLTAGALTINLAALTGLNGTTEDLTGLRVQFIRIKNLGANAMTFSEGASNGIALAGLPIVVPVGGIIQHYFADAAPDVASADRTIDVAGTGAQTFEMTILAG